MLRQCCWAATRDLAMQSRSTNVWRACQHSHLGLAPDGLRARGIIRRPCTTALLQSIAVRNHAINHRPLRAANAAMPRLTLIWVSAACTACGGPAGDESNHHPKSAVAWSSSAVVENDPTAEGGTVVGSGRVHIDYRWCSDSTRACSMPTSR